LTQVCDVEWQHPVATAHGSVVECTVGVKCGIRSLRLPVLYCGSMHKNVVLRTSQKAKRQVVKPAALSLKSFSLVKPQPEMIIRSQRLANEH
jgi:hypothetical protein